MRKTIALGALLALGIPGVARASEEKPTPRQNAAQECRAERKAVGDEAFRATYGTNESKSNAFGKCVSTRAKEARSEVKAAKKTCKAERRAGAKAFKAKYGTNRNKSNAFGKCVSASAKEEMKDETEDRVSASETCKKEQDADPAAFTAKYGTNDNKSNAFGKCVSGLAKEQGEDDDRPKDKDRGASDDDDKPGNGPKGDDA